MVDFQERDTRRSLGSEDGDDDGAADDGEGESGDEASAEETAEQRGEPSSDGGEDAHEPERTAEHEHAVAAGTPTDADHDHHAEDLESVSAAVLTISTSRSMEEDGSGDAIVAVLEDEGHAIATRELVNDDYDGVQSAVAALVNREDVDAVVTTGGTGVAPEDVTPEAVRPLFEKELPGFGEAFRSFSREEIGTRAIATRAIAGIADGVPVFCLPGSEDAVRLGVSEVVEPEVCHLAGLSRPHGSEG